MDLTDEELLSMMGDSMDEEEVEDEPSTRPPPQASYLPPPPQPCSSSSTFSPSCPGFDRQSGDLWIYPTNYPVRQYQLAIVEKALFHNTLVSLPTGLGKTFIAAVVMYNFYR